MVELDKKNEQEKPVTRYELWKIKTRITTNSSA